MSEPTPRKVEIAQTALDNMGNEILALRRKVAQLEHERMPEATSLDNLIDKLTRERDTARAQLAARDARLKTIAELAAALQQDWRSGRIKDDLQVIETLAKGETS